MIILPGCLLLYMIPGALNAFAPEQMTLIATVTTGIIFIVFFLMSPSFSKHLFFADWSDDFHLTDMTETKKQVEQTDRFENIGLTPREKEIAAFLSRGQSAKWIAVELRIKFDTVKFHIKNLYKKLGISSKSELFVRFGVEPVNEDDNADLSER